KDSKSQLGFGVKHLDDVQELIPHGLRLDSESPNDHLVHDDVIGGAAWPKQLLHTSEPCIRHLLWTEIERPLSLRQPDQGADEVGCLENAWHSTLVVLADRRGPGLDVHVEALTGAHRVAV